MIKTRAIPKQRFPEFSEVWEQKQLAEITTMITGGTPSKVKSGYWNGTIPWLTASSMRGKYYTEATMNVTEAAINHGTKLATENNLLVLVRGGMLFNKIPIGIVKKPVAFNQDMKCLIPKDEVNPEYLFYYLSAKEGYLLNQVTTTGIGVAKLDTADLKKLVVMMPNQEEQQKIVDFFISVDQRIEAQQRKLAILQKHKQGLLQQMLPKVGENVPKIRFFEFTDLWQAIKLGDFLSKSTEKNQDLAWTSEAIISIAKMKQAVTNGKSTDKYLKTYLKINVGDIAFEGHSNLEFPYGRFVFNDFRAGIVSHIYQVYHFITPHESEFMKLYLNTDAIMRPILKNATSKGEMVQLLDEKALLKQAVLLPSLSEQARIGAFFKEYDHVIALHQHKLAALQMQKKGLLQKLFV
ncbi:MAG: restriction endonuclease subunit S [Culicoidibacterales bacterium]